MRMLPDYTPEGKVLRVPWYQVYLGCTSHTHSCPLAWQEPPQWKIHLDWCLKIEQTLIHCVKVSMKSSPNNAQSTCVENTEFVKDSIWFQVWVWKADVSDLSLREEPQRCCGLMMYTGDHLLWKYHPISFRSNGEVTNTPCCLLLLSTGILQYVRFANTAPGGGGHVSLGKVKDLLP